MKRFRRLAIALLLALAGSTAAQVHVAMQSYYPVIRVSTAEGVTYTTLLEPAAERSRCAAASRLFLASLKARCEDCEVLLARCERSPEDVEEPGTLGAAPVPQHVVAVPGLRIEISGPAAPAARGCEVIARDLAARGLDSWHQMEFSCTAPGARDARTHERSRRS